MQLSNRLFFEQVEAMLAEGHEVQNPHEGPQHAAPAAQRTRHRSTDSDRPIHRKFRNGGSRPKAKQARAKRNRPRHRRKFPPRPSSLRKSGPATGRRGAVPLRRTPYPPPHSPHRTGERGDAPAIGKHDGRDNNKDTGSVGNTNGRNNGSGGNGRDAIGNRSVGNTNGRNNGSGDNSNAIGNHSNSRDAIDNSCGDNSLRRRRYSRSAPRAPGNRQGDPSASGMPRKFRKSPNGQQSRPNTRRNGTCPAPASFHPRRRRQPPDDRTLRSDRHSGRYDGCHPPFRPHRLHRFPPVATTVPLLADAARRRQTLHPAGTLAAGNQIEPEFAASEKVLKTERE